MSRLLWASHVFYNILFFVLLTSFVYCPTLLVKYPHPLEIVIIKAFVIPSLFPPYTSAFLGYLTINILFLISVIFRKLAFRHEPNMSFDDVTMLLNARTLISFLPLIQTFNIVFLAFPFPRLALIFHLFYPLLPIAITIFIGFFLALHFLADTHNSVRHTFEILLRTVFLDSDPGNATQFHPIAGRIVYYLFAFSSLYLFWGAGIAGMGMKMVKETDWHAERVRQKAVRLLRYLPNRKTMRRKRLFGRGKVLSSMPFNMLEALGIGFRLRWIRAFSLYFGMVPIVVGWSLGLGCIHLGLFIWGWMRKIGAKLIDEVDDEIENDANLDPEDANESTRLLA